MNALEKVRLEIGPFTAFVAGSPVKYSVALFVLGLIAGAIAF